MFFQSNERKHTARVDDKTQIFSCLKLLLSHIFFLFISQCDVLSNDFLVHLTFEEKVMRSESCLLSVRDVDVKKYTLGDQDLTLICDLGRFRYYVRPTRTVISVFWLKYTKLESFIGFELTYWVKNHFHNLNKSNILFNWSTRLKELQTDKYSSQISIQWILDV